MATHWITYVKIAGPVVKEVRNKMLEWAPFPLDGVEPISVTGASFMANEKSAVDSMCELADHLEVNAKYPPIMSYLKFIDPWTVAPVLYIYNRLCGKGARPRLVRSDLVDMLLIQPTCWQSLIQSLLAIKTSLSSGKLELSNDERIFSNLIDCTASYETLLSEREIDRGVLVISKAIAGS